MSPKLRKILLWALTMTLIAGLVWAGADLLGQSNKKAADAGANAADMEMASIDSVKPSVKEGKKPVSKATAAHNKVKQADSAYRVALKKAQSEIDSSGKVSQKTYNAGMAAARKFQAASEEYAATQEPVRAKMIREAGASRIKSAEMAFSDIDASKIDDYNSQQDTLRQAQKEYYDLAKTDVSEQDRAAMKAALIPTLQRVGGNLAGTAGDIMSLLSQVKDQVGMSPSAMMGGCARQAATSGSMSSGATALLSPLQSLLSLVKGMGSNVQGMISDISSL